MMSIANSSFVSCALFTMPSFEAAFFVRYPKSLCAMTEVFWHSLMLSCTGGLMGQSNAVAISEPQRNEFYF